MTGWFSSSPACSTDSLGPNITAGSASLGGPGVNNSISPWLELESDPGLFTLLLNDFGVRGVQVEEIYDLTKPIDHTIYGFIFLFKWVEKRLNKRKASQSEQNADYVTDPNVVNNMFFAHQIAPNSCATHALLSILLNCNSNKYFHLGEMLESFKKSCQGQSPEAKGLAISGQSKLAQAHNSYAKSEQSTTTRISIKSNASSSTTPSSSNSSLLSHHYLLSSNQPVSSNQASLGLSASGNSNEVFHFICFLPINGHLYELDGLKPCPIDHGPISKSDKCLEPVVERLMSQNSEQNLEQVLLELASTCSTEKSDLTYLNWTTKFKQVIKQRLNSFNNGQPNHEIRFNLMAVVPDKISVGKEQIELKTNNSNQLRRFIDSESISTFVPDQNTEQCVDDVSSSSLNTDSGTRLLRSAKQASLTSVKSSRSEDNIQVEFNLRSCDIIGQLLSSSQFDKPTDSKLVASVVKLLENKFNLLDLVKSFRIESISSSQESKTNNSNDGVCFVKSTSLEAIKSAQSSLDNEIQSDQIKLADEIEKRKKYKVDAMRRKHNYEEFILTYLKLLAENGKLTEIVKNSVSQALEAPQTQQQSVCSSSSSSLSSSCIVPYNTLFLPQTLSKRQRKKL